VILHYLLLTNVTKMPERWDGICTLQGLRWRWLRIRTRTKAISWSNSVLTIPSSKFGLVLGHSSILVVHCPRSANVWHTGMSLLKSRIGFGTWNVVNVQAISGQTKRQHAPLLQQTRRDLRNGVKILNRANCQLLPCREEVGTKGTGLSETNFYCSSVSIKHSKVEYRHRHESF
jgi:hypothetical protein